MHLKNKTLSSTDHLVTPTNMCMCKDSHGRHRINQSKIQI